MSKTFIEEVRRFEKLWEDDRDLHVDVSGNDCVELILKKEWVLGKMAEALIAIDDIIAQYEAFGEQVNGKVVAKNISKILEGE